MKFSVKGHWSWDLNGSVSDRIKKILSKIKNIIVKNDDDSSDTIIEANSIMEMSYEASLDINCEEMIQLMKCTIESDKNALQVLKELGHSAIKGAKELREAAAAEIPEWQKIMHQYEMQQERDEKEIEDLHESLKNKSE